MGKFLKREERLGYFSTQRYYDSLQHGKSDKIENTPFYKSQQYPLIIYCRQVSICFFVVS